MNFACGKLPCVADGAEALLPWYAIMIAILFVALVVMLLKTKHR
ncbi:hypothetical protein [Streptomyces gibsoniae]|uniref:Disulfide bond formation protein B n=1 Tax=Streptomyces gibsoniae TaxID=3075529 RepID=A0ABU2U8P4_9ACTN|nr:hypothetical protein [Streptomyces sp. DSM 41699]MDT0469530.1 hypothetical protein [Streptomyces sp. DSM 41699]